MNEDMNKFYEDQIQKLLQEIKNAQTAIKERQFVLRAFRLALKNNK